MTDAHHKVSVVVTTYNRPDALYMVLKGLHAQTYNNFEVIVADDGSGTQTMDMTRKMQLNVRYHLNHIWQEDRGFRAAKARNKAVAASKGAYLIFLDGDCVPLPGFIQKHMCLAESGWFVRGNRVMLSESFTRWILENDVDISQFNFFHFLRHRLSGRIKRIISFFYLPLGPARKLFSRKWKGAKTCNLGMWRKDFIHVNGFDERYTGWGHEDADLVVRLIRSGVYRKEGNFYVPALHLWHALNDRSQLSENESRLQEIIKQRTIHVEQGLSQYL